MKQTQQPLLLRIQVVYYKMKLGIEREGLSHKMRGIHIVDLLLEAIETNS